MEIDNKNQNQDNNQKLPKNKNQQNLESYCPLCNTSFLPEKATVIEESQESWLLHTNCAQCSSSIVLMVLVSEIGISSFGLVTDLTKKDIVRYKKSEIINSDNLIDLYQALYINKMDFISFV
ncbi:MAG: hypothetical protein ACNFW9_03125 [Candidatus Kerfeldbacteria bacterium]